MHNDPKRYCTTCGRAASKKNESCYICEAGHENWINPAIGAVVCVIKDGKVLFGVRSQEPGRDKLCLPGGFTEVGESSEETAIREAKEELGIDIELIIPLKTYASRYHGRPALDLIFVARIVSGQLMPGDDMSGGDPVWRDIEDLPAPEENAADWYERLYPDLQAWWRQYRDAQGPVQ